ncbi:iron hydrogenase [Entophlyctis helioformis]|nr:iron hydrogenase [Entophlyctis helioformis]
MSFSSALVLTDLNDFITPSQACIKPAQVNAVPDPDVSEVKVDAKGRAYEVTKEGTQTKLEAATISLNDCLACSGCITSAETVLITMQSHKELFAVLEQNRLAVEQSQPPRIVVVSVAPQSRASLATKYGLSTLEVHRRLMWFLKTHLGVDHVFDVAFARDLSLVESAREFVRRYKASSGQQQQQQQQRQQPLPMLASACPGWICYAEKTHPFILPHIDSTKSPQQVMGSLVKDHLAAQLGVTPDRMYHVAVMPCYDKKLEASRQDFYSDMYKTRDVDCVITTGEVERMFREQSLDIRTAPGSDLDPLDQFYKPGRSEGTSSGGYLSYILRYAAKQLFGADLSPSDVANGTNGVTVVPGRNPDSTDVLFTPAGASEPALRFAYSYGFRNIQNLVRKVKTANAASASSTATNGVAKVATVNPRRVRSAAASGGASAGRYHYVEVMACPSGCINGGGQLKPETASDAAASAATQDANGTTVPADATEESATAEASALGVAATKAWIAQNDDAYHSAEEQVQLPEDNAVVWRLYNDWLGGSESSKARTLLHTVYHAVAAEPAEVEPSAAVGLAAKW